MTKFNFHVNENGARIHFFLSLAGINPVMGSSFVDAYRKKLGRLSGEQLSAILEFKKIYVGMEEKDKKQLLSLSFLSRELDLPSELQTICQPLESLFETFWKPIHKGLKKSREAVVKDSGQQKERLNRAIDALNILLRGQSPEVINVFLVPSPIENISGKYLADNTFYIEIPSFEELNSTKFWLLLLHETIHASYEPFEYKMWLKEFAEKQKQTELTKSMGPKNILRELIDEAIAPNGYFANYLYSIDIKSRLREELTQIKSVDPTNDRSAFNNLKRVVSYNLYSTIDLYIKESKPIDEELLGLVWKSMLDKKMLPL